MDDLKTINVCYVYFSEICDNITRMGFLDDKEATFPREMLNVKHTTLRHSHGN